MLDQHGQTNHYHSSSRTSKMFPGLSELDPAFGYPAVPFSGHPPARRWSKQNAQGRSYACQCPPKRRIEFQDAPTRLLKDEYPTKAWCQYQKQANPPGVMNSMSTSCVVNEPWRPSALQSYHLAGPIIFVDVKDLVTTTHHWFPTSSIQFNPTHPFQHPIWIHHRGLARIPRAAAGRPGTGTNVDAGPAWTFDSKPSYEVGRPALQEEDDSKT